MSAPAAATSPPSPLETALKSVGEFPDRLGPVLVKELRQGLRSGLFVMPFLILPAVLAIVAVWALTYDNLAAARGAVRGFFWVSIGVPVLLLSPLRALGTIRSEREAQTLDLLQLTPLTAWRIVLAKWSSLQAQAILWVVALLPFFVLRYFFGAMDVADELVLLGGIVLAGAMLTAVCLVISTLPRLMFWITLSLMAAFALMSALPLLAVFFGPALALGGMRSGGMPPAGYALLVGAAVHVSFLALTFAASRIAPPADNYAMRMRLGTLTLFAWFGLATFVFTGVSEEVRWPFLVAAAAGIILSTIIEVTSPAVPLAAHLQGWSRFGRLGTFLARPFLPGWPSAVLFFSVACIVGAAVLVLQTNDDAEVCVLTMILWSAVLLPRAAQCLFKLGDARPGLHILLHLGGGFIAGVLSAFGFVLRDAVTLIAAAIPSALWWVVISEEVRLRNNITVLALVAAAWILINSVIFYWSSRGYWNFVARHGATARQARRTQPRRA